MPLADNFNADILKAVETVDAIWRGKGYDINSYFTHDLAYGPDCCVKANHAPLTMCVAAVSEIIIEALNSYYQQTGDGTPFQKLLLRSWRGGSRRDIRAHIFMYDGVSSHGTAHALETFGIGVRTLFSDLQPGSFINFNRTNGSGHACIFLGFLNKHGDILPEHDASVMGYKYYSAQGKGFPDAGFGYRWAFFDGNCPQPLSGGRRRDCGVIQSSQSKLFCCGHLLHPAKWPEADAIRESVEKEMLIRMGASDSSDIAPWDSELPAPDLSRFDGVTTD